MPARRARTKKKAPAARRAAGARVAVARARTVRVRTAAAGAAAYDVQIGSGMLAESVAEQVGAGGGLVVVDAGLPRALVEPVIRAVDGRGVRWGVCVVSATEADKSLSTLERVLCEAAAMRVERGGTIVALGGGIVGDVAGLAASVYRRGVRVVQCPTTLLAMVDASVGGKTAVNLSVRSDDGKARLVKNMAGSFHQPSRVLCDVDVLRTLPARHLRCGLAECIKHAVLGAGLGDPKLFDWTEQRLDDVLRLSPPVVTELVARNVAIKARVVARDPFEQGEGKGVGRSALNMGHTFAHALETLPGLSWTTAEGGVEIGPLLHGEAVGLGLLAAARLAASLKVASAGLAERLDTMLARAGLPRQVRGLPKAAAVIERMRDDKKVASGRVRLVLPARAGGVRLVTEAPMRAVADTIDSLRDGRE